MTPTTPVSVAQLHEAIVSLIAELQAFELALTAEHAPDVDQLLERTAYVVRLETALRLIRDMPPDDARMPTPRDLARRALELIPRRKEPGA